MASANRAARVFLLVVPLLPHCMPDFQALSAGVTEPGTAGSGGGQDAGTGGTGSQSGEPADGGASGETSAGARGGVSPTDTAGAGGDYGAGAPAQGGQPGCEPDSGGVGVYNGFDGGLDGPGFSGTSVQADVQTTLKATASALWDSQEGHRCVGSLRLSCNFKAYPSGSAADEKAFFGYYFERQDWSDAAALHAVVKVSPEASPILGIRLFVLSGDSYLYTSTFDGGAFVNGGWNEMVLPLRAGVFYDPTNVYRLGVEVVLLRADSPSLPAAPPVVDVWVDDLWLEPK